MKPPICHLCHKEFAPDNYHSDGRGSLVSFADYKPLPENMCGHPHGQEWFCPVHLDSARKLSMLTCAEALAKLKEQFGINPR